MKPLDVSADALTADLKTRNNELSFWRCTLTSHDAREVALALAAGFERPEKIFVLLFPEGDLRSEGILLRPSDGQTPVSDLRERHADAIELTADTLCRVAKPIAYYIRKDGDNCFLFTKREVLEILAEAIREGRLALEDLKDKVGDRVADLL